MRRMRGRAALGVLIVSVAMVAAACSSSKSKTTTGGAKPSEGTPVKGGTLVDLQDLSIGEPEHIDPQRVAEVQGSQIGVLMWDRLTKTDFHTGKLIPDVASKWTHNDDFTHSQFTLRKTRFSNGDPVLPSSFVYAWNRLASPALASDVAYHVVDNLKVKGASDVQKGTVKEMSGLKADDTAMTLDIDLEAPLSFLDNVVSHLAFAPIDVPDISKLPDTTKYEQGIMIGNGPYKQDKPWAHNKDISLVRNDNYDPYSGYKGQYLDGIDFIISKDVDSAWAAFQAGQGDTGYIPQAQYTAAQSQYQGRNTADVPLLALYDWDFNMKDPEVGGPTNVKLRQAISLIIDRDAMIRSTYNGSRQAATGIAPPNMPGYKAGLCDYCKRDVAAAKAKLAEWESESGKKAADLAPIKLNFGAGASHNGNATIIQANLAELGIKSTLDPRTTTTYFSQMRKGQGQFLRSGWSGDYVSYDNFLFPLFDTEAIGGDNLGLYSSPEFDDLIVKARKTPEGPDRDKLYQQAEQVVLNKDTASVMLNWYRGSVAWTDKVHNVTQSPLFFLTYDEMWKTA